MVLTDLNLTQENRLLTLLKDDIYYNIFSDNGEYILVKTKVYIPTITEVFKDIIFDVVVIYKNLLILLQEFVDIDNMDTIYCNTTKGRIVIGCNIVYRDNKITVTNDSMRYNIDSINSPDWVEVELPKHCVVLHLPVGCLYIEKFKDDVSIVR